MQPKYGTFALALLCLNLTGCALNRSEIKLNAPVVTTQANPAGSKGAIFFRSISDKRVFEQAPRVPSTPSLGFEGADKASDDVKARAIARKRNSYGNAMGDVLLDEGQTVTSVMREYLAAAFTQAGYTIENDAMADSLPTVIDVDIKKFWSWMQPGFWAITLNADIQADLKVAGAPKPKTIAAHVEYREASAHDGAWMVVIQKALIEFRAQAVAFGVAGADSVAKK